MQRHAEEASLSLVPAGVRGSSLHEQARVRHVVGVEVAGERLQNMVTLGAFRQNDPIPPQACFLSQQGLQGGRVSITVGRVPCRL